MTFNVLTKIINKLTGGKYILLPKYGEGLLKNGTFSSCDLSSHELVDKSRHFILEKGKYRISLRDQKQISQDDPVGMFVVDNSQVSYDKFWGSEEIIISYLDESRVRFFNQVIKHCKKYIKGQLIEIGCGSGDFLRILGDLDINATIHGIDFSESSIKRCKKLLPAGHFKVVDIYNVEYPDNIFDVVLCIEVLEHLEKPDVAFKEMARICKNNGIIIITIPNGAYDEYIGHLNFWSESEFRDFTRDTQLLDFKYLEDRRTMLFVLLNR